MCVCVCVCAYNRATRPCHPSHSMPVALIFPRGDVCVLSFHLFWTSGLWTHQRGSHRRKVTQDFSTFLLRGLPQFLPGEGFSRPFPSSTVKSNFAFPRINRSPLVGNGMIFLLVEFERLDTQVEYFCSLIFKAVI